MAVKRAGYEGILYYGTAGSTGATQLTNATDIEYTVDVSYAQTTARGDGTTIPIQDNRPDELAPKLSWTMIQQDGDTALAALIAAATHPTPSSHIVALRYKRVSGSLGYDGDMYISVTEGAPLKGAKTFKFTGVNTSDGGRTATLNS